MTGPGMNNVFSTMTRMSRALSLYTNATC